MATAITALVHGSLTLVGLLGIVVAVGAWYDRALGGLKDNLDIDLAGDV